MPAPLRDARTQGSLPFHRRGFGGSCLVHVFGEPAQDSGHMRAQNRIGRHASGHLHLRGPYKMTTNAAPHVQFCHAIRSAPSVSGIAVCSAVMKTRSNNDARGDFGGRSAAVNAGTSTPTTPPRRCARPLREAARRTGQPQQSYGSEHPALYASASRYRPFGSRHLGRHHRSAQASVVLSADCRAHRAGRGFVSSTPAVGGTCEMLALVEKSAVVLPLAGAIAGSTALATPDTCTRVLRPSFRGRTR
jgi:hypothetical protein